MMLEVINCSKNFGRKNILENITFTVKPKEKIALVGKNGVGKTTMLNLIVGINTPSSGKILFKQKDLFIFPECRRNIGFASTEPVFYEKLTTYENLELIGSLYGVKTNTSILEIADRLNINYFLNEPVAFLSTGMKRRLQLATVLIHQPDLILLDEPFNGLDIESVEVFKNIIKFYQGTVIFTSHYLDLVLDLSEKIFLLQNQSIQEIITSDVKNNRLLLEKLKRGEAFNEYKKKSQNISEVSSRGTENK